MATILANQNGNWSATSTWVGGVLPTSGDVVVANNKTITIDISPTVSQVRNDTTGGATSGGVFNLNNGITLRADVYAGATANISLVNFNLPSPNSANIIGNLYGGSANGTAHAVTNSSSGTLNITGNCAGSSGGSGVNNTSNGIINITGNCIGGMAYQCFGVWATGSGTITIVGNITGGSSQQAHGVQNGSSTAIINITGNVFGGTNVSSSQFGVNNNSTGTINITGNVYGGYTFAVNNASTGTVSITGSAIGGNISAAANNASTGVLNITRAAGNGFGLGTSGITSQPGVVSAVAGSLTNIEEIEYGSLGQSPTSGPIRFVDKTSNVALFYRGSSFSSKKTLVDSSVVAGGVPASSDVRSGVSYNLGANVGSCVIPNANSVVFGVLVDGTTGSAVLSPASVWNFLISNMSTSGSIGERVKNCSTVASVGKQLEQVL
ncbi:MAG: hypothetical protein WCO97_05230 [bacterium]